MGHRSRRILVVVASIVMVLLVSSCGAEEATPTFSPELRTDFLSACNDSLGDPEIVGEVCKCVFDKSQRELSISVFASYEATLKTDATADLPEPLADMMARCVLEESGLGG